MVEAGIPDLLFERYGPLLEWHSPWEVGRKLSFLMRGKVDSAEVNELLVAEGHEDLRFLDNGVISYPMEAVEGHTHAYHLVPGGRARPRGSSSTAALAATTPRAASRSATRSRTWKLRRPLAGSSASRTGRKMTRIYERRCPASET